MKALLILCIGMFLGSCASTNSQTGPSLSVTKFVANVPREKLERTGKIASRSPSGKYSLEMCIIKGGAANEFGIHRDTAYFIRSGKAQSEPSVLLSHYDVGAFDLYARNPYQTAFVWSPDEKFLTAIEYVHGDGHCDEKNIPS